jgi:SPP1 family phage portal protein
MAQVKESYITEQMEVPQRIVLPRDTEVTDELIKSLVKIHEKSLERYQTLENYYKGGAKILQREKAKHKSNNKIIFPYPSYIVDVLNGMFLGKPVSYFVNDKYKDKFEAVQDIMDLNEEQDENAELGKMAGIKGRAYEIVYVDEESNMRFNEVEPDNIILVFDDEIKPTPWLGIYITDYVTAENIDKDKKDKRYTVYTETEIVDYIDEGGKLTEEERRPNDFGEVPIVEFLNNNETLGDFERQIPLIDAMNLAQSDTANDLEEFTDAILVLYGALDTDSEDIQDLLEQKVLLLDNSKGKQQDAEWLIKNINDTTLENYKERLDKAIFKFAKVPDLSDENFAGNSSGEAMKFKLFGTDQVIAQKQNKFRTGLQTRLRLILKGLGILTGESDFDYRDITISFFDNKPYNELDNINAVKTALQAGLSKKYALSKLKDLDDIQEEIRRQEEDASAYADVFNFDKEVDNGKLERPAQDTNQVSKDIKE